VANAATLDSAVLQSAGAVSSKVRVRFAPSPTGYLHVGGARTALFNWLYAKNTGGTFVLRVEDTDRARSTKDSEDAVLEDLKWLGLEWDEGPGKGGPHGPYRQSERTDIYGKLVEELVQKGVAFPCFCSDLEIEQARKDAQERNLPPVYRGKWAQASAEEVEAEKAKGTPFCYRFRVPKHKDIVIKDTIRGDVKFNTDTLGDFVIMRSNGLPVYNFCVAADDALMQITHVIRAEEHLPNTLRQVLIYNAFDWKIPNFAHVSLILAADKSKLSKRHGATSVGEFREQGCLASAMVNFLSLLGWNDGTEQEIFTPQELQDKFSLGRINKSAAVFDRAKLDWMNGQYLKTLPIDEIVPLLSEQWTSSGLLTRESSPFVQTAARLVQSSLHLVNDANKELQHMLDYPFTQTLASEDVSEVLQDDFPQVVRAIVEAHDSGALEGALKEGEAGFKKWLKKALGKEQSRKGKRLFMPTRVALTGSMHGPEIGGVLELLHLEDGDVADSSKFVKLEDRIAILKEWLSHQL